MGTRDRPGVLGAQEMRGLQKEALHLRRNLLGALSTMDRLFRLMGLPPILPTKEERQLIQLMREKRVNIRAVREFVESQLS